MPVSITVNTAPPLGSKFLQVTVLKYDGVSKLTLMPNLRILGCKYEVGAKPGQATFRYVFDPGGGVDKARAWPTKPEQVLGPAATGPYVVKQDDRICAYVTTAAGDPWLIFDGFVQMPAATISSKHKIMGVSFVALGTAIREWDTPTLQRRQRDADQPTNAIANALVALPIVFNPKLPGSPRYQANCVPKGSEATYNSLTYPIFIDEVFAGDAADDAKGRAWDLSGMVKYLLAEGNPTQKYVKLPAFSILDGLLNARTPDNGEYFDEDDPSSYTAAPIVARELDVKGKLYPEALEAVLARFGFQFWFSLTQDNNNLPVWKIRLQRVADDNPIDYEEIYLQAGGNLDSTKSNVVDMHLVQDPIDTANAWVVESRLLQVEGAFVLAPNYIPSPADASSLEQFNRTSPNFPGNEDFYRSYVFDECGEGHYNFATSSWVEGQPPSLVDYLGGPDAKESNYVRRRRPGKDELFTLDPTGQPKKSLLLLSTDYKGPSPGVWDGTGTWFPLSRTWRLLDDRLGIYINSDTPEAWSVSNKEINFGVEVKSSGGAIKAVSAQALTTETHFTLMLVTVIEGDQVVAAQAPKRDAVPSRFTVTRMIDARESFQLNCIEANTWFNRGSGVIYTRDDTDSATLDAEARRTANEMPKTAGPVKIGHLTQAYQLGDRITELIGRNIDLDTSSGSAGGEGPTYPRVVAIEYEFAEEQATILHLEDGRGMAGVGHESWRRG